MKITGLAVAAILAVSGVIAGGASASPATIKCSKLKAAPITFGELTGGTIHATLSECIPRGARELRKLSITFTGDESFGPVQWSWANTLVESEVEGTAVHELNGYQDGCRVPGDFDVSLLVLSTDDLGAVGVPQPGEEVEEAGISVICVKDRSGKVTLSLPKGRTFSL